MPAQRTEAGRGGILGTGGLGGGLGSKESLRIKARVSSSSSLPDPGLALPKQQRHLSLVPGRPQFPWLPGRTAVEDEEGWK